ncbi:hypothetical protein WJ85_16680 [Burkholderia ubonensis]|nr:hypothetical protein WJ85_16680 [Burkholderia ubonensis]KWB88475.1 hypothetical protein WL44_17855 [Burkholderia ubonensis]
MVGIAAIALNFSANDCVGRDYCATFHAELIRAYDEIFNLLAQFVVDLIKYGGMEVIGGERRIDIANIDVEFLGCFVCFFDCCCACASDVTAIPDCIFERL